MLPADQFIRIHRSFMVNIFSIKSIVGNQIRLEGANIPIGQSYKSMLKNRLL